MTVLENLQNILAEKLSSMGDSISNIGSKFTNSGAPTGFAAQVQPKPDIKLVQIPMPQPAPVQAPPAPIIQPQVPQQSVLQAGANKNPSLISRVAGGVDQFMNGFNENYNNGYKSGNLLNDNFVETDANGNIISSTPKTGVGRLGEAIGTMGRVAQNPVVQGLVAALIAKKVNPGGGWRNAANIGLDIAQKKGASDANRAVLKQMGYGNVPNSGIFGNISDKAVDSIAKNNKYQNDYYARLLGIETNERNNIRNNETKITTTGMTNQNRKDVEHIRGGYKVQTTGMNNATTLEKTNRDNQTRKENNIRNNTIKQIEQERKAQENALKNGEKVRIYKNGLPAGIIPNTPDQIKEAQADGYSLQP